MSLTVPAGWTQSSGCLPSGDLWGWAVSEGFYADMFGGPTVTSSCYPPSYQPTSGVVYATDSCPDGFSRACATSTGVSSFTVCCPTAYPFSCQDPMLLDVATLFCRSRRPGATSREWVTSSFTKFAPGLQSVETYTATIKVRDVDTPSPLVVTTSGPIVASDIRAPGQELFALPVLITGTSTGSTSTAQTSTTDTSGTNSAASTEQAASDPATSSTTSAASSSGGLSTGAAAGIGAGAGVAGLLLACGGWLLYRRGVARGRRSGARLHAKPAEDERITAAQPPPHGYHHTNYQTHELELAPSRPTELETTPPRPIELDPAPPRPRELE
ncbi:hypothetical protein INS49_003420 [Diaporthe citri]|uniref:uncharacterized protein n=1 Tax=Diaporthe citri TaxID=83186 RepID=UPI001C7EB39F|nr:uncharacterized protein INS49_003420 [Diaporthe citri]KAG6355458.1 hypothetical protein INS49_003420 [Diaporthe citri]